MNEKEAKIENLAARAHDMWSHWMAYMYKEYYNHDDSTLTIPTDQVKKWYRLINRPYDLLTEDEKKSDRKVAEKYLL